MDKTLRRALLNLTNKPKATISWAKAQKVDEQAETCTVVLDEIAYPDVPLAVGASGVCVVPQEDSEVLVSEIEGTAHLFVLAVARVKKIKLRAETIECNGAEQGGLLLAAKTLAAINALEKEVNKLKNALSTWIPAPPDGGAALKTALGTWPALPMQETQLDTLENKTILQ